MDKAINFKLSKKIVAIMILLLTILNNISPIFAASGTGRWVGGQYASGLITTDSYNGGSGVLIRKLINNSTGEAITVFCAEHGVEFKTDRVYAGEYSTPPTQALKQACKVAYFGWYGKHGDYLVNGGMLSSDWLWLVKDYVFTQQYIWEIQGQSNATFTNSSVQSEYEAFKQTINNQIAQMQKRPSFDGDTITVQIGEEKVISDSNGVLSSYNTIDTTYQGVRIRHTQGENTLNLYATDSLSDDMIVLSDSDFKNLGMIKAESADYDTSIYFSFDNGAQAQLYTLHYNDPVPMSLFIEVEAYGRLELSKLDTQKNLIDGSVFNVTGPNGYNQDVTVSGGKITLEKLKKGTYTIIEKSAPTGYIKNTESYTVEVKPNETTSQAIVNDEPTGKILIYKVSENNDKLAGAQFTVTANENITNKAGSKTYYTKGQTVATIETKAETGIAQIENLPMGKYIVKEVKAPEGYLLNDKEYEANLVYENDTTPVVEIRIEGVKNNEPTGKILIYKVSEDNDKLKDATFEIIAAEKITNKAGTKTFFTNGQKVITITTDTEGIAQADDLPLGKYIVKETQAPNGYLLNEKIYTANLVYKNDTTPVITIEIKGVVNKEPRGSIGIIKKDSKTGSVAQGDATLEGAVYNVYADEDIYNVAKTKKWYSKGDLVATRTTDEKGDCEDVTDLPLGKYKVKEEKAPIGYMIDKTEYTVELKYKDQYTKIITGNAQSTDKVKEMKVHIFKSGIKINSGETPGLAGAIFTIKLNSAVQKAYEAGYTYEEVWGGIDEFGNKVQVDSTRVKEAQKIAPTYQAIETDENGDAYTEKVLPYGTYIVKETKTPKDYESAADFTFSITNDETEIQDIAKKVKHIIVNNEQQETYIKLIKKDLKTGKTVTLTNATFQIKATKDIYDRATGKILYKKGEAITQKIGSTTYNSFTTNAKNIVVPTNSYNNKLDKLGTVVTPLKLEVGSYEITEILLPEGFLVLDKPVTFKVEGIRDYDKDQDGDFIKEITVNNEQPTGTLKLNKTVALRNNVDTSLVDISDLSKIEFKLTAKENIIDYADGSTIYKKGQEIGKYNLTKDGKLEIKELPMGLYELQEIKTLDGLILNDKIYEVKFEKKDNTTKVYINEVDISNETTIVELSKIDITGEKEIIGATMQVIDTAGNVVDTWISKEESHKIEGLIVGETYTLRETIAPNGYVKATDITFKIENTNEVQKTTMIDKIVEMSKTDIAGNEIEGAKIQVLDEDENIIDEWISGKEPHIIRNLEEGKNYILHEEITADGYVKATDLCFGVSFEKETQKVTMIDKIVEMSKTDVGGQEIEGATIQVIDKEGNIVDEWVSEKEAHKIRNLEEGEKYILHEEITADGYVKASDYEFEVTLDKETQKVVMIDKIVDVTKTDFTTGEEIEGAELTVTDEDGNIIDSWTSSKEVHHIIGLEEGKKYTLTETTAPYGYEITESIEFEVTLDKENQLIEMKDKPILKTIGVVKVDSQTNEKIYQDFTFGIYEDEQCRELIKEAKADKDNAIATFEELRYGVYFIKEIKAPKGYQLSDKTVKIEINDKGVFADEVLLEDENSICTFEYYNEKIPEIQTGDETNLILIVSSIVISLIGIITGIIILKRKNR